MIKFFDFGDSFLNLILHGFAGMATSTGGAAQEDAIMEEGKYSKSVHMLWTSILLIPFKK